MTDNNGLDNGRDGLGRVAPGNPGKPKGSTKNRLRDNIKTFIEDKWEEPAWFEELKPKEKFDTTMIYTHGSSKKLSEIKSPFDDL